MKIGSLYQKLFYLNDGTKINNLFKCHENEAADTASVL